MSIFDVKLVIVGESGCGKTALLQRLVTGRFARDLPPTYGTEFGAKRVEVQAPEGSGATCRPSLGVWDTSGAARFHALSRRFLRGADAVLVCWDPTNRSSWDSLRAWVADARAEEPAAQIFLAATKADLAEGHSQASSTAGAAQETGPAAAGSAEGGQHVPAGAAQARGGGAEQLSTQLSVSVEHWQGDSNGGRLVPQVQLQLQQQQQQQQQQQHDEEQRQQQQQGEEQRQPQQKQEEQHRQQQQQQEEQQQQQQQQQWVEQQQDVQPRFQPTQAACGVTLAAAEEEQEEQPQQGGDGQPPPLPGGGSRGSEVPLPAAPITPTLSAARSHSPAGEEPMAGGAPERRQPIVPRAASGHMSRAERVLEEHAAAPVAEPAASLTGQELPSAFAGMSGAAPSHWPSPSPSPEIAEASNASQPARPRPSGHTVQWAFPEVESSSAERSEGDDWEAPADEPSSQGQLPRRQAAAGVPATAPQAVPQAAVDTYCSSLGGTASRMMWLSARTGQGVGPAFAVIAQEVLNARWARQRSAGATRERQEGSQRGGRGWLAHRSSSTGDPSVGAATPGRAAQRGPRAADSRLVLPQSQAAARLAAGAPGRAASGASMRSSSRSTSLGDDSWFQDYLQECSVEGGQLGRRTRRPEEQPCRMT
ncbi:hypothetical protein ABPG77_010939 [Micractinium sp. CCAP 211/92]